MFLIKKHYVLPRAGVFVSKTKYITEICDELKYTDTFLGFYKLCRLLTEA